MPTTVTLGKLRFDIKGDHSTSTQYYANDIVTFRNQQYICTTDVGPGSTGDVTPNASTYWSIFGSFFNFRSTWTSSTLYRVGDVVNHITSGTLIPSNSNFNLVRSVPRSYICVNLNAYSGYFDRSYQVQ